MVRALPSEALPVMSAVVAPSINGISSGTMTGCSRSSAGLVRTPRSGSGAPAGSVQRWPQGRSSPLTGSLSIADAGRQ